VFCTDARDTNEYGHDRLCSILEPLPIMAHVTQGSGTRLYHVLITLGNLFRIYSNPDLDTAVRDKVLGSLEKRWAAAVLNPYLQGKCFSRTIQALTPIGLCNLLKRLHLRVFRKEVDSKFQAAFMDYYYEREEFSPEWMQQDEWKENAKADVSTFSANILYTYFDMV
jgi:hypothetical protein